MAYYTVKDGLRDVAQKINETVWRLAPNSPNGSPFRGAPGGGPIWGGLFNFDDELIVSVCFNFMHMVVQKRNIVAGIFISILFLPIWYLISLLKMKMGLQIFINDVVVWLNLVLLFIYTKKLEGEMLVVWQHKNYNAVFYITTFLLLYLLVQLSWLLSDIFILNNSTDGNAHLRHLLTSTRHLDKFLLFFTAVTAGITEELIFRAYLIPRLIFLFRASVPAIILSAFMFSMIHIGYRSRRELFYTFFLGIIFGAFYSKYKSIKILIVFHIILDILTFS